MAQSHAHVVEQLVHQLAGTLSIAPSSSVSLPGCHEQSRIMEDSGPGQTPEATRHLQRSRTQRSLADGIMAVNLCNASKDPRSTCAANPLPSDDILSAHMLPCSSRARSSSYCPIQLQLEVDREQAMLVRLNVKSPILKPCFHRPAQFVLKGPNCSQRQSIAQSIHVSGVRKKVCSKHSRLQSSFKRWSIHNDPDACWESIHGIGSTSNVVSRNTMQKQEHSIVGLLNRLEL